MVKIGKWAKEVGLGAIGVVNIACGIVINSVAGPYGKLMGNDSPRYEALENSKYFF